MIIPLQMIQKYSDSDFGISENGELINKNIKETKKLSLKKIK